MTRRADTARRPPRSCHLELWMCRTQCRTPHRVPQTAERAGAPKRSEDGQRHPTETLGEDSRSGTYSKLPSGSGDAAVITASAESPNLCISLVRDIRASGSVAAPAARGNESKTEARREDTGTHSPCLDSSRCRDPTPKRATHKKWRVIPHQAADGSHGTKRRARGQRAGDASKRSTISRRADATVVK
eukprot:7379688-Prymnesium_polylepis.1